VLLVVAVYAAEDRVAAVLLATVVGVRVSERRQSVRRKRAVSLGGIRRHLIQMTQGHGCPYANTEAAYTL